MNIMLNGEVVEELSTIVHASKAREYGKRICTRLKESIPKQLFQVAIQATVGGKILARENISALRKDVTAKCVSSVSDSLLISDFDFHFKYASHFQTASNPPSS